jgi:hypothetical protein
VHPKKQTIPFFIGSAVINKDFAPHHMDVSVVRCIFCRAQRGAEKWITRIHRPLTVVAVSLPRIIQWHVIKIQL